MKNEKGITLISLVTAVVLLILISSVAVNINIEAYDVAKSQNFIAKMQVIQSKVDNVSEQEINDGSFTKLSNINEETQKNRIYDIIKNPQNYNINVEKNWDASLDENPDNYYFFSPDALKNFFGLKDQDIAVIINFKTRNVISIDGVKVRKETYYRQYDLQN